MKKTYRILGITIGLLELLLATGCVDPNGEPNNTGTGAIAGGLFGAVVGGLAGGRHGGRDALIGGLAGVVVGGLVGHMIDRDQQQRLREQSPQTLQTIQHNDAVYQQRQTPQTPAPAQPSAAPTAAQPSPTPAPTPEALIPLSVDDIKALEAAGVKKDVIIAEIQRSKSVYKQSDVDALQQSSPNIDPAIIECMRKTVSS